MSNAFVDDIGTVIQLDAGVDMTAAGQVEILYRKPNRQTGIWNATVATTFGSYTTVAGDLDVAGTWVAQLFVTNLDGWTGHGSLSSFNVLAPIS